MSVHPNINWLLISLFATMLTLATACSNQVTSTGSHASPERSSFATADAPKEIRIGYQVSPNGELLAKALGLLEKNYPNTKINWLKFDSGRDVNTAMASGSIDFGLVGTPPGAIGIAKGLPYQVYYLHDVIGESEALIVKKSSGIQSLHDLKGKKIATTFSSTSHFSLLGALKTAGLDPEKDKITILDMQPPDIYAAWKRNDIDGAYIWQPTQAKLVSDSGTVIVTSKELADKGVVTAEFGIVHKDFAQKYPHIVKGYVSLLDQAVHYYREKPEQSAQLLSKELELSPEESLQTMRQIIWLDASEQKKYFGQSGQPGQLAKVLKDTGDYLVTQKAIPSAPDVTTYQQALLRDLYK
ncbi:aliphatic sulfonate ABC transporter substrate-binding protein [Brevibacillus thermoruber]|uniref:taurine ABC transporter substrate-binding protein n=1 Tax=Brevibacillus thermoruber TaxID=33942 RepID=UPI00055287AA|nr:aliphatic sulfonate ABC transporter substrate-binding protein [Brevibacillus thermoruber]